MSRQSIQNKKDPQSREAICISFYIRESLVEWEEGLASRDGIYNKHLYLVSNVEIKQAELSHMHTD